MGGLICLRSGRRPSRCRLRRTVAAAEGAGQTAVVAGWERRARAVLVVADTLRPGSAAAVDRIQRLGLRTALVTGDSERTAHAVADQLKIPRQNVFARVRPEAKAAKIRQLQAQGYAVAMVGDGVNDAAALAQADLGMATGTGTDAAIGAADLTLVNGYRTRSPRPCCWRGSRWPSSGATSSGPSATT